MVRYLVLGMLAMTACQEHERMPEPDWIVDEAEMLTEADESQLIDLLLSLNDETGVEMACVLVDGTGELSTSAFAHSLLVRWEVGRYGVYNGIVVVIDTKMRQVDLAYGDGIQWILNQAGADSVVAAMTEHLADDQYFDGVRCGIEEIAARVSGITWNVEYYSLSDLPDSGAEGSVVNFSGRVRGVNGDTVYVQEGILDAARVLLLPGVTPDVMGELWDVHGRVLQHDPLVLSLLGVEAEEFEEYTP